MRYIEYMTGVVPLYLPSWCEPSEVGAGTRVRYAREHGQPILLGMYRDNLDFPNFSDTQSWKHPILRGLTSAARKSRFRFKRMHELYEKYEWWQIMRHPALILIPYQVSTISFFEIYRTGMPIFAPSLRLLCKWVREYGIMWERIYGLPMPMRSASATVAASTSGMTKITHAKAATADLHTIRDPNTNCTESECALEYWLGLSDWYIFKHVQYFDSWEELVSKLETANLNQISQSMLEFNREQKSKIKDQWSEILQNAVTQREGRKDPIWNGGTSIDFNHAMKELYGAPPMPVDAGYKSNCWSKESDTKVYKCVSSDDALYYGCTTSFDAGALHPDGDTVVSCRTRGHTDVGEMCPKSLPYCEGYRLWTPKQSRRMGKCFRMMRWRTLCAMSVPFLMPTIAVAIMLVFVGRKLKTGRATAMQCSAALLRRFPLERIMARREKTSPRHSL